MDERPVVLTGADGVHQARFFFSTQPPWSIRLVWADGELESEGNDLFECLVVIRQVLDLSGVKVCCAGARADVYPSGMARQMSGGRLAYVHHHGRRSAPDDVVDIFDPADPETVVTVAEQKAAIDGVPRASGG